MSNRFSFAALSGRIRQAARVLLFVAAATLLVVSVPNSAYAGDDREPYAIGLWGDLPYSTVQATVGVPNLIADMNSQNLASGLHRPRRRPEERFQRMHGRGLHSGSRIFWLPEGAGGFHSRRQRLDRLRSHRRLQFSGSTRQRAGVVLQHVVHAGPAQVAAASPIHSFVPGHQRKRSVRGESPLDL